MNLLRPTHAGGVLCALLLPLTAFSQSNTNIGRRSTGVTPGMNPSTGAKIESRTIVKLGAARNWTSVDGKVVVAELMSWPLDDPKATSKDVSELKFDVVRGGQIRLRKNQQTFTLPVKRLSADDQAYVKQVVENIAKSKSAAKPQ